MQVDLATFGNCSSFEFKLLAGFLSLLQSCKMFLPKTNKQKHLVLKPSLFLLIMRQEAKGWFYHNKNCAQHHLTTPNIRGEEYRFANVFYLVNPKMYIKVISHFKRVDFKILSKFVVKSN